MPSTPDPSANGHHPGPVPRQDPPAPDDRLLNKAEVAQILGGNVTASTVIRRWRKWQLPAHRVGKQLRWWESDVYQWISDHPA
jgi:predicted DNA-binding transcriptional regulator AlpA